MQGPENITNKGENIKCSRDSLSRFSFKIFSHLIRKADYFYKDRQGCSEKAYDNGECEHKLIVSQTHIYPCVDSTRHRFQPRSVPIEYWSIK